MDRTWLPSTNQNSKKSNPSFFIIIIIYLKKKGKKKEATLPPHNHFKIFPLVSKINCQRKKQTSESKPLNIKFFFKGIIPTTLPTILTKRQARSRDCGGGDDDDDDDDVLTFIFFFWRWLCPPLLLGLSSRLYWSATRRRRLLPPSLLLRLKLAFLGTSIVQGGRRFMFRGVIQPSGVRFLPLLRMYWMLPMLFLLRLPLPVCPLFSNSRLLLLTVILFFFFFPLFFFLLIIRFFLCAQI